MSGDVVSLFPQEPDAIAVALKSIREHDDDDGAFIRVAQAILSTEGTCLHHDSKEFLVVTLAHVCVMRSSRRKG
jgi:hypothetical protein